jgi:hypothetical protein
MPDEKVISFGYSLEWLRARNQKLSDAGFRVYDAFDEPSARRLVAKAGSSALITGHLVPEAVRNRVAHEARRVNPNIAIVMLYDGRIENAALADAALNTVTADHNLAEVVRHLVAEKQKRTKARRRTKNRASTQSFSSNQQT